LISSTATLSQRTMPPLPARRRDDRQPPPGACPPAGIPALEQHTTPHPAATGGPPSEPDPPPETACADRRRRQEPAAADAGALPGASWPRRLLRRATNPAQNQKKKINYKNTGLTGPAPTGMTASQIRQARW